MNKKFRNNYYFNYINISMNKKRCPEIGQKEKTEINNLTPQTEIESVFVLLNRGYLTLPDMFRFALGPRLGTPELGQ